MNILENGLHSLKNAINNLKQLETATGIEREFILKDTIIGLHHSIETLFKHLVKDKQEILIYKDLNDYFTKELKRKMNGDSEESSVYKGTTITFMEAIDRAFVLNKLDISKVEYNCFQQLNILRNSITHHEYDLTEEHISFVIAQVLSIIFPIYKSNLANFKEFVRDNDLDLKGTKQVKDFHIWRFIRHFSLLKKAFDSKDFIDTNEGYNGNPQRFRKEKDKEKESYITYYKCPCCQEEYFKKEHVFFEAAEEVMYYGKCLACGLLLNKDDAHYIQMTYRSYESFLELYNRNTLVLQDLMYDDVLGTRINEEDLSIIHEFINDTKIGTLLSEYIESAVTYILDDILQEECYSLDYDGAELDDAATWEKTLEVNKSIDKITEYDLELLKQVTINCNSLQINPESYENAIKKAIDKEFEYETSTSYTNPHTNDDHEINVKVTLRLNPKVLID
ncbi:hypothetical protein [Bacillus wiedmannii]|uniref:hypothetical protein n=1 Tax=Bacillus wiedmannii TaxID=1890302 RepID=UPI000BEFA7BD|nr:hypothetical protein [Bacillus wiedmannii]PEM52039.1 hypothetical protein CN618_10050 [Bacillus wiedmannii]